MSIVANLTEDQALAVSSALWNATQFLKREEGGRTRMIAKTHNDGSIVLTVLALDAAGHQVYRENVGRIEDGGTDGFVVEP